jgi:hypothetical protein
VNWERGVRGFFVSGSCPYKKLSPTPIRVVMVRISREEMVGGLLKLAALVEVACDYANGRISLEAFGQR